MLSGMLAPDEGECYVGNINVVQNVSKAREDLGLCPQHNILIRELTVREHFQFFAELKGYTRAEANSEIKTLVTDVQLGDKIDELAYDLSGGMKRKLSLGIALCGGSTNLILDEPSSGIDVRARRELWTILEKYRANRTMLLSTHYMDEAEQLADRIVIISAGKLKCSGTTHFLKEKLGSGYHLTMSLSDSANLNQIEQFVQNITPSARLDKFYGKEAQYVLPFDSSGSFPDLFRALDQNRESIQVQNYGISVTTMDEIFMTVTNEGKEDVTKTSDIQEELLLKLANRITLLNGFGLLSQQLRGAFVKCAIHAARNWKVIAMQLILPAIMTILAAVQILAIPVIGFQDSLDLSLETYKTLEKLDIVSIYTCYNDTGNGNEFVSAIGGTTGMTNLTGIQMNGSDVELVNWIPEHMQENLYEFNEKYVIGMETGLQVGYRGNMVKKFHTWFNGEAFHSVASGVLYTDKTLLETYFPGAGLDISTKNFPLPATLAQSLEKNTSFTIQGSIIAFNLIIGLMIMYSAFSMLPVRERATGVKTMQKCSGAPLWLCWLAEYLWDLLNSLPPILITLIIFAAFQKIDGIKVYVDNMDAIFVLMIMFSFSQLPFGYCCSFIFDTAASALTYCSVINIALGLITMITVSILEVPGLDLEDVAKRMDYAFCMFPQYDLARGLFVLYINANIKALCTESEENEIICEMQNITYVTNAYSLEDGGIGRHLLAMGILCPVLFGLLAFIEFEVTSNRVRRIFRRFCRCCCGKRKKVVNEDKEIEIPEDIDVTQEKQRIKNSHDEIISRNPLVVDRLSKTYGAFTAVDEVSFHVEPNRCFGLLGPNGAGKTSLFKMLTGEHQITSGSAFINKLNVHTERFDSLREFGYCPQFDALLNQLTGRETLVMYARLRGVPESSIKDMVENLLLLVGIESYGDKRVEGYSGGTKRKLSVAVALTGFPPVLVMDEPSCGLDPGARRQLWSVISGAQKAGAAVLLTSHSMEETAALCNSLAIMVNGKMRCIGGQQYLKSKFGNGVEVELQIERETNEAVKAAMDRELPYLSLIDEHECSLKFRPNDGIPLGDIFEGLEKLKNSNMLNGYTVHQSTLEQIFLALTEHQRASD